MVLGQDLHNLCVHVPPDGQGVEVIEVMESELAETPCSCPVTLPGLWLHQQVVAEGGQMGQELPQAVVAMVQVDPHGD